MWRNVFTYRGPVTVRITADVSLDHAGGIGGDVSDGITRHTQYCRDGVWRRLREGRRCGGSVCHVHVVGHSHRGDSPAVCALHVINVTLHEGTIRRRVREVIGTVRRAMVHEKAAAFYTTFVVVEELTF